MVFFISSCGLHSNYKKEIIGDWELVSTENSSGSLSTADKFSQLYSNSINNSLSSIKITYSFGENGNFMSYGGMHGLKQQTSEDLLMIMTAKQGTYTINGNDLTITTEKGIQQCEITELSESEMKLKEGDQIMIFKPSTKIQQDEQKYPDYSSKIIGKWEITGIFNTNGENLWNGKKAVMNYKENGVVEINHSDDQPTSSSRYVIKRNKIILDDNSEHEIIELNNDELKLKISGLDIETTSVYKRIY